GIYRAGGQDVLRIDILVATSLVVPADENASAAVGDHSRGVLIARRRAQGPAIGGPSRIPNASRPHMPGIDVKVAGAVIEPADDRAAGAIRDDRCGKLAAVGRAKPTSIGGP